MRQLIDRQTYSQTDRLRDERRVGQTDRRTERQIDRQTNGQIDRQTKKERKTERKTDRRTGRVTERNRQTIDQLTGKKDEWKDKVEFSLQ